MQQGRQVAKHPLETKIIEEIKEKPPEEPPPPPPKLQLPPPPFIPPPEVQIQVPVNLAPTISTTTHVKPAAPSAPTPHPVVEAPKPAVRRGVVPIFRVLPTYPRKALKDGTEGSIEAQLMISPTGEVTKVVISKSVPPGVFDKAAIEAMMQYKFKGDGTNWIGIVEIDFKLD